MKRLLILVLILAGLALGADYTRFVFSTGGYHGDTLADSVYTTRGEMEAAIAAAAWDSLMANAGWGILLTFDADTMTIAVDSGGSVGPWGDLRWLGILAQAESAATADNASLLQGRDSTDYDNAKLLQGKDTLGLWVHAGTDSTGRVKADSLLGKKLYVANTSAIADTGRTVQVVNTPAQGTVTQYGSGLSDITWATTSYAGHNTADTFFVAVQYAGATDTFKWKQARTGTYAKWLATTSKKAMAVGCSLTLAAATGHTLNDSWLVPIAAPCPLDIKHSNGTGFAKIFPDGAIQNGYGNTASGLQATVGGGGSNTASSGGATVGGGGGNAASGTYAAVGGGGSNTASGTYATVGGGNSNTASGARTTVGGGNINTASGTYATVGGGNSNAARGYASFVPGSEANLDSAPYSFALGCSTRVPVVDSFSGVIGHGAGGGRLVGSGKRTITLGVVSPNLIVWENDSVSVVAKLKVGTKLQIGNTVFDSIVYPAADTSTLKFWIGTHSFTITSD